MRTIVMADLAREAGLGTRLGTRLEGKLIQALIVQILPSLPDKEALVIDLEGLDVFSCSFADEAIVNPYQWLIAGDYRNRDIVVKGKDRGLFDDLDAALMKRHLAMFAFQGEPSRKTKWFLLGENKPHLFETLKAIAGAGQISTGRLAKELGINLQACSNQVSDLFKMRLIKRERVRTPRGGVSYLNKFIV